MQQAKIESNYKSPNLSLWSYVHYEPYMHFLKPVEKT